MSGRVVIAAAARSPAPGSPLSELVHLNLAAPECLSDIVDVIRSEAQARDQS